MKRLAGGLSLLAFVIACGPEAPGHGSTGSTSSTGSTGEPTSTTATGQVDSTGGASTGGAVSDGSVDPTGSTGTSTTDTSEAPDCAAAVAAIAAQVAADAACTAVIRLDYETYAPVGSRILCDPFAATTEAEARATAEKDTGFGLMDELFSGPAPADAYVFYKNPSDYGGVGVVSARSGKSVFGGEIIWIGDGVITYPTWFDPSDALGPGCDSVTPQPGARGWDLIPDGVVLPDADVLAALDVVWTTALPDGLATGGSLLDAVVLLYPPRVGFFDSSKAEWVVLINAG